MFFSVRIWEEGDVLIFAILVNVRFGAREKMCVCFFVFLQFPCYTSKNLSMKGVHAGTCLYTSNVRFDARVCVIVYLREFTDSRLLLLLFLVQILGLQSTREVSVWLLQITHS